MAPCSPLEPPCILVAVALVVRLDTIVAFAVLSVSLKTGTNVNAPYYRDDVV